MSSKPPTTLPTPVYQAPGHYWIPSFNERERAKGIGYDVKLGEHGWCCNCYWCKCPYACKHVDLLIDYLFEQDIISVLPEPKPLSRAKQEMAKGHDLAYYFDYSSFATPPTHVVTNRGRVAARR